MKKNELEQYTKELLNMNDDVSVDVENKIRILYAFISGLKREANFFDVSLDDNEEIQIPKQFQIIVGYLVFFDNNKKFRKSIYNELVLKAKELINYFNQECFNKCIK